MDQNLVIALCVVTVVTVLSVMLVVAKKKNINIDKLTDGVEKLLEFLKLVIQVVEVRGLDRTKSNFVLDVADLIVDFVSTVNHVKSDVDKRIISLRYIDEILANFGVKPSKSEQKLIEIIVNEALKIENRI
ncbi:hypothetical protein [Saccharibacillus brassicae]|uniref:Uncharacterized protein n=1 Tax=Saccharibacillus brassicae TaxID=2583377 RepID=A0A4Y6UPI1_SACBS|nr:hypothetical protein [Saccharibacillus brassicae]QDH19559.1 hypothetical protein FFV09_01015 [Saccharibacillus brassicae]